MGEIKSFMDLRVWQVAMALAERVYVLQRQLPKEEIYGLGDQIRRAIVSVPSNIAEGFGRDSTKDFIHYLMIARGSLFEVRTQLILAERFGYFPVPSDVADSLDSVGRMINSLATSLRTRPVNQSPSFAKATGKLITNH